LNRKWVSLWLLAGLLALVSCQGGKIICKSGPPTTVAGGGSIHLAWDSAPEPAAGYKIYYGTSPGKYRNCIDIGKGNESNPGTTQYILTGLTRGATYFVAITAYSSAGGISMESGFSNEVSAAAK
jgi:hypothetical protein